jgi:hypothetical protein
VSDPINRDGWIELDAFCAKYGERKNTVHKRATDGTWPRGVYYSSPSGGTGFVHEERAVAWLKEHGKLREVACS